MTVSELFDQVVPRLKDKPACSIVEAVQRVQTLITNRLMLKRSDILKTVFSLSIGAGDDQVTVPATFSSMAGRPYILDETRKYLTPFDNGITPPTTAARPKYYERIARKFYLYPTSDASYTITMPAYFIPAAVSALTDEVPFDGTMDDIFKEAVYGVMLNGVSAVADPAFAAFIETQVDQVILSAQAIDEQTLADTINAGA